MDFWCEVDKKKLYSNIDIIRNRVGDKKIVAVVKGNAYGLGIGGISKYIESKVDLFGVATLDEANKLKTQKDILIMSPVCSIPTTPKSNYIFTIDSFNDLNKFKKNTKYRVHIYLDSGMNRLGIKANELDKLLTDLKENYPSIKVEGLYTHLHNATNIEETKKQIFMFRNICEKYIGIIPNFHCLNSKGIVNDELLSEASFTNIVRAGNALYGYDGTNVGIQKVFSIKAKVIKQYTIETDGYIGYGAKRKVKAGTKVGVLPCGTIDKLTYIKNVKTNMVKDCLKAVKSHIKPSTYMYYKGKPIFELCTPNMNCTLIDLTNIETDSKDIIVELSMGSILLDSSIEKRYI